MQRQNISIMKIWKENFGKMLLTFNLSMVSRVNDCRKKSLMLIKTNERKQKTNVARESNSYGTLIQLVYLVLQVLT